MPELLSVNAGPPKNVAWRGQTVYTGIWKHPVHGPVMVRRLNIDGDGPGDLNGHGGEQRADVCDVPARWSCRTGVCHTCITPLLSGDITYARPRWNPQPTGRCSSAGLAPTSSWKCETWTRHEQANPARRAYQRRTPDVAGDGLPQHRCCPG